MGEAKDIPIIIISGDKSAKYRRRAQAAEAVGFFPKPIDHVALVATIRATLGEDVGDKPPEPLEPPEDSQVTSFWRLPRFFTLRQTADAGGRIPPARRKIAACGNPARAWA